MSVAKERTETYKYFPRFGIVAQAKHLIEKALDYRIHKVNDLHIFKFKDYLETVNEKTMTIKCFDTEQEALDYCLDYYESTKKIEQQSLF